MTDLPRFPGTSYQSLQPPAARQSPWAYQPAAGAQPILDVVQEPSRTRVTRSGRPKMRFTLEPPPIVRLRYSSADHGGPKDALSEQRTESFKLNPRLFVLATLLLSHKDSRARDISKDGRLVGSTVASPHMLRNDIEAVSCDMDLGSSPFFVFGDLSVTIEGRYRMEFNLYELNDGWLNFSVSTMSKTFEVVAPKECPNRPPVTHLSLACHNQGVRLRIRKAAKRKLTPGPDSDSEVGRETTDQQRHKYRRLMPNDPSWQLRKYGLDPVLYGTDETARRDTLQHWSRSSRQTPLQLTPNPRQYTQGPSPGLQNPPRHATDGGQEEKAENTTEHGHSKLAGQDIAAPNRNCVVSPRLNVAVGAGHQFQGFRPFERHNDFYLTPPPWLGQRHSALVPLLSAARSPFDSRVALENTSTQSQPVSPSAHASDCQGSKLPHADPPVEWDCLNLSIPSPTGGVPPPRMDFGLTSTRFDEWLDVCS